MGVLFFKENANRRNSSYQRLTGEGYPPPPFFLRSEKEKNPMSKTIKVSVEGGEKLTDVSAVPLKDVSLGPNTRIKRVDDKVYLVKEKK